MNLRCETNIGWLTKAGSAWADCIGAAFPTSNTDASDFTYLYIGKRYWQTAGPTEHYALWKSFVRFVIPTYPASQSIKAARLVLSVDIDGSDTDFDVEAWKMATPYETPVTGEWTLPAGTLAASAPTTAIKTGAAGLKVLEVPFSAAGVAMLSAGSFDFRIYGKDVSIPPTGDQYIRCYTGASVAARKPYLVVLMSDARELIVEGIVTALGAIDALTPPYNATPKTISDVWQPLGEMMEPEFPVIFVHEAEDALMDDSETIGGNQIRMFKITLVAGVYESTRALLRPSIFRTLADIRHVMEAQRTATPKLGITGVQITDITVLSLRTEENYLIDDNKAQGIADINVSYLRTMNES